MPVSGALPAWLRSAKLDPRKDTGAFIWTAWRLAGFARPDDVFLSDSSTYAYQSRLVPAKQQALVTARASDRTQAPGCTELVLLAPPDRVQRIYRLPVREKGILAHAWLDDQHAVVGSFQRTIVVRLADGSEVASVRGRCTELAVGCKGQLVAARLAKGVGLFAWTGDELVGLAKFEDPLMELGQVIDDVPTVRVVHDVFALEGVEAALAGARPR